jgi:predicted 2-oxoglutarate/Fe(II)-dependent dioxygenase YbiX
MKMKLNQLDTFYFQSPLFTKDECSIIIKYITHLQDTVYTVKIDNAFTKMGCSLKSQHLEHNENTNWIFDRVIDVINEHLEVEWINKPPAIFRNYSSGDFFVKHKDNVDSIVADKRYLTVSIQLSESDDYIGGDVILNDTQKLSREIGSILLWGTNVPHTVTLIKSGERNSLVFFVSEKNIKIKKILI